MSDAGALLRDTGGFDSDAAITEQSAELRRPLLRAMLRGAGARCPACGTGRLFDGYLCVRQTCEACGEALHHHRADDAPPYFTTLIVGHVIVGLVLSVEVAVTLPLWVHAAIWLPLTLLLSLALLRPIKGALVGLQWANRMHGFGGLDPLEPAMPMATAASPAAFDPTTGPGRPQ